MAKAQFFVDRNVSNGNLWNASFVTLTASSAVSALPGANSQNPERATVWRSVTGTGAPSIDLDLGSGYTSYPCTGAALANVRLVGTNASRNVKLQTRGNGGSPGTATDIATFATQDSRRKITYVTFTQTTARHWRLLWSNADTESDYAELGYAFLGKYFEPGVNWTSPADLPYQDKSTVRKSQGGQTNVTRRDPYYEASLQFSDLLAADFAALQSINDVVGAANPFFLALDADNATRNYLARFVTFAQRSSRAYGRVSLQCRCEEWL